jgi:hypothetical protein
MIFDDYLWDYSEDGNPLNEPKIAIKFSLYNQTTPSTIQRLSPSLQTIRPYDQTLRPLSQMKCHLLQTFCHLIRRFKHLNQMKLPYTDRRPAHH